MEREPMPGRWFGLWRMNDADPAARHGCAPSGLARLARERRSASALEFALLTLPLVAFLYVTMEIIFDIYCQLALDYSLSQVARQVQLGLVPNSDTPKQFQLNVFCPVFSTFQNCNNTTMYVSAPVLDYYDSTIVAWPTQAALTSAALAQSSGTTTTSWCYGSPGQLMFMQVTFVAPTMSNFFIPAGGKVTVGSATGRLLVSSVAFANENPSAVPVPSTAGC